MKLGTILIKKTDHQSINKNETVLLVQSFSQQQWPIMNSCSGLMAYVDLSRHQEEE